MDREDLLARMLTKSVTLSSFDDWVDILTDYAEHLNSVKDKLSAGDIERFVSVGASFYRTLARAEAYRVNRPAVP
ncbi:Uncharacterised protein [Achromobacter denitrificans]|jgi:hypothetical protein|uniref:DNA-3-methyladenine glycosylase n=2 Tax=Alcaligenaceae TaxID=506 RepID=A0A6J5BNQ4_ACHDE|nr:hypothetical protein [Achromobacter denitrificans]ASC69070.1 DNA-3-methyladenine glycosylase [Achromobacter denitrificans]OLU06552.1 hypothetical protein BVK87_19850 [Achromobacter denitrificans]QKH40359.1 DNA-3-methyladenine glycosylase [Achromobacter denitrificans]QKH52496.1 DNA-3-methyladenine glycosylase [Achromobacter denitrificans]QKQ48415.1 DNA-3-methyladenine glycosylase [Achromobacter denitrificans]